MAVKAKKMKMIKCGPPCGFMVKSHDEDEIVDIAVRHVKNFHNMKLTKKDIEQMRKTDIKEV
jgi:predicted small metal-binding protein